LALGGDQVEQQFNIWYLLFSGYSGFCKGVLEEVNLQ